MSYIEKNLLPQEQIVYRTYLHWIIYGQPFCAFIFALAVLVFGLRTGGDMKIYYTIGGLLGLMGLAGWVSCMIQEKTSEFAVTDKRVLIKVGFIRRHSVELLLRQVEGIGVDQGIVGRVFGYGTITVSGTGGTTEHFQRITNPLEFRRQVQILTA